MQFKLGEYLDELVQIVYPRVCVGCSNKLPKTEELICLSCVASLPLTNFWNIRQNKMERQLMGRVNLKYAVALCHFSKDSVVQNLLHELKYKGETDVGVLLGEMLGEKLNDSNLPKADAIVPIPLHWKKQQIRGYNQSDFIAEGLSKKLDIPVLKNVVERVNETASQTRKNLFERIENVSNIFKVCKPESIEDKHILLVDDVMTTGSTLESCAEAIALCQNTRLSIATIAFANH